MLTGSGHLYLAGGGCSVLTGSDTGWTGLKDTWIPSVALTPHAALSAGKHTVLLAGPPADALGVDKAVIALDTTTGNRRNATAKVTECCGPGQSAGREPASNGRAQHP